MTSSALERSLAKVIKKNYSEQTAFLAALVRARSVNHFTPEESKADEPVEKDVAEILRKRLKKWGLKPRFVGATPMRPNVVCSMGPKRSRKSLLLNGNMATSDQFKDYTLAPFSGAIRGNRLYGVGAYDMKATLTAYMYAVKALVDLGVELDGRLTLEFVVDQEPGASSAWGTAYLLSKGITAKAAIVGEPGTGKVAVGHRGGYRFKLTAFGEAVNTGLSSWERGEQGRNAIVDMARVITALQKLEIPFKSARAFPGREPVFTFPVKIRGGSAIGVVAERCSAYGDVRLLPGTSDKQVKMLVREKLLSLPDIKYEIEDILFVPAVEVDAKEEIVETLVEAARETLGRKPVTEGAGPWNDAWMLIKRDIPTVCGFGPDGDGAHGPDEWVDLVSLQKVTEIYAKVIVRYLGVI